MTDEERQSDAEPKLRHVLERCRTVLANMAEEDEGGGLFTPHWPIHHEPLRADAKNLLPIIDAALAQSDDESEPSSETVTPIEARLNDARERIKELEAQSRPDASAGLIEAAKFTNKLLTLSFDKYEIDSCEISELGQKLGLLERAAYDPKKHGQIDCYCDEGDEIFILSSKGRAIRARAANKSSTK